MRADLAQKQADTRSKLDLSRCEPWQVAFGGMAAGAGLFVAATGLLVALASLAGFRLPSAAPAPQQIVIQLAPGLALVPSSPGKQHSLGASLTMVNAVSEAMTCQYRTMKNAS